MSDDLISRSALLEELKSFSLTITGLNILLQISAKKSIMRIVDEQPTAYDVEKVVEQLENEKAGYFEYGRSALYKAIEIVKAGGESE